MKIAGFELSGVANRYITMNASQKYQKFAKMNFAASNL